MLVEYGLAILFTTVSICSSKCCRAVFRQVARSVYFVIDV